MYRTELIGFMTVVMMFCIFIVFAGDEYIQQIRAVAVILAVIAAAYAVYMRRWENSNDEAARKGELASYEHLDLANNLVEAPLEF